MIDLLSSCPGIHSTATEVLVGAAGVSKMSRDTAVLHPAEFSL
jgi:hypothetical protein